MLAVLIDPEEVKESKIPEFIDRIPKETTHLFVGGSTVPVGAVDPVVEGIKANSDLPVVLFPGSFDQVSKAADGILFLSLLSGRNPEYLIGQQLKAVPSLNQSQLEVIPTAYVLIDGGSESAVARVTGTDPLERTDVNTIVNTAKAGEYMGSKLVYLEAGSGALEAVPEAVIRAVCEAVEIPVIVGGGIRTEEQKQIAYAAGATLVVIGTALEETLWKSL